jgi:hypothetical protein
VMFQLFFALNVSKKNLLILFYAKNK